MSSFVNSVEPDSSGFDFSTTIYVILFWLSHPQATIRLASSVFPRLSMKASCFYVSAPSTDSASLPHEIIDVRMISASASASPFLNKIDSSFVGCRYAYTANI